MTLRTIGLTLVFGALAAFPAVPAAPIATGDAIINLGTLGHDVSYAVAVNNKRQIVGWITDNFKPFRAPFLWEDGVMRELTSGPDLVLLGAGDINDRGQIAGSGVDVATSRQVAFVWQDGQPIRLPTPPGDLGCDAESINERGDVLGSCVTPDGDHVRSHAVLWRHGAVLDLGAQAGGQETVSIALNDRGVVLGAFRSPDGLWAGNFVWAYGVLIRLDPALFATDLNDRGQIVGAARLAEGGVRQPVILHRGTIVPLRAPTDGVPCWPETINQRGDVGGWCGSGPTVWVRGVPKMLPALSEFGTGVTDLNDRGDAVGFSTSPSPDYNSRAVLWPAAAKHRPRLVDR